MKSFERSRDPLAGKGANAEAFAISALNNFGVQKFSNAFWNSFRIPPFYPKDQLHR